MEQFNILGNNSFQPGRNIFYLEPGTSHPDVRRTQLSFWRDSDYTLAHTPTHPLQFSSTPEVFYYQVKSQEDFTVKQWCQG